MLDAQTDDVFMAIKQLAGIVPGGADAGGAASALQGDTRPLIHALTRIQLGDAQPAGDELSPLEPSALSAGKVNVLRDLKSTTFADSMNEMDTLTLDVVSMLFDYILDDKNVPPAMKALIGRLQIPVLKAAMLDKSIFSKRTHPVRRLLDTLAQAAIGWNEEKGQDDPLFQKVDSIVRRVLEDFQDNLDVFQELLAELESFLAKQSSEAEKKAEDSTQAIEGREQLALASTMAQDEVRRRIESHELPEVVRDFLRNSW